MEKLMLLLCKCAGSQRQLIADGRRQLTTEENFDS